MNHVFGAFELDDAGHELRHAGETVAIQPKALELLAYLIHNRDRLVGHDEIFENIWPGENVTDWSLTFCMKMVRRAIRSRDADLASTAIRTVRGRGYRFVADVTASPSPQSKQSDAPSGDSPTLLAAPSTAPTANSLFVGREAETERLNTLLDAALIWNDSSSNPRFCAFTEVSRSSLKSGASSGQRS